MFLRVKRVKSASPAIQKGKQAFLDVGNFAKNRFTYGNKRISDHLHALTEATAHDMCKTGEIPFQSVQHDQAFGWFAWVGRESC